MNNTKQALSWYGLPLAILGITMVGIGEWLLLFNKSGYDFTTYAFLINKTSFELNTGHWLSVLFAPFYLWGYYVLYQTRQQNSNIAKTFWITSLYTFSLAGMWISARSYIAYIVQSINKNEASSVLLQQITHRADPLLYIAWVGLLLLSILFFIAIKKHIFPVKQWLKFFPPLVILPINFIMNIFMPAIGVYMLPTAMNITHIIFFGLCYIALSSYKKEKK